MRMKHLALFLALGAALLVACGRGEEGGAPAPELARIACSDEGARVLTPRAEPRPDGLHVELTNETAREVHVTLERGPSAGIGLPGPPGAFTHVLTIGPGEWTATCYGDSGSLRTAALEVVDTGIWVSTELTDCETSESTHGDPPRRIDPGEGELVDVARRALDDFLDLEPGYTLERAGYPEQAEAVFRARGHDRTIATMSFWPDGSGGWVEGEATTCPERGGSPEPGD